MGNENYNDEMVERVHQALKQLPDSPPGKRTAKCLSKNKLYKLAR
jgi:hypothetical protein